MKQAAIPPLDVSVQIKDAKAGCKNLNEHALELSQVFVIWSHLGMEEYFSNILEFNDKDKTVSMPGKILTQDEADSDPYGHVWGSIAIISPRATVQSQHSIILGPIVAISRLRGRIKWPEMK